tara:strand:- start:6733 stop:7077 length:345 start_codon:yes stop_codon:yes gene_type:complete
MPIVGDKSFPYTEEGYQAAEEYADMVGLRVRSYKPPSFGVVPSFDDHYIEPPRGDDGGAMSHSTLFPAPRKQDGAKPKKKRGDTIQALLDSIHEELPEARHPGAMLDGIIPEDR